MSHSHWVHLDVTKIHRETDKAFEVELESGELLWLPKSQISEPDTLAVGDEDLTVSISEWLANQKGL